VRNDSQSAIEEASELRNVSEFVNEEGNEGDINNEKLEAEPQRCKPGAESCTPDKPKPKKGCRPCKNGETPLRLRDKTNCPDCGKQISVHALNYSHSKVCKQIKLNKIILLLKM